MIIIEKNEGTKVDYVQKGTVVSFMSGELALDCARYQRDWGVHLDICMNADGNLVIGTTTGLNYVAQLDIPARQYDYTETDTGEVDDEGNPIIETNATPIPLDMKTVTLSLWAISA